MTVWGWVNNDRMFISENLLTPSSKWPRACRKLSSSLEKASVARRDVSFFRYPQWIWLKWRTALFWKICPNVWQIQLKWRSHLFKRSCFPLNGHRWPLKRTFEDSCQWSDQNEQNQMTVISSNKTLNRKTVLQIINSRHCA